MPFPAAIDKYFLDMSKIQVVDKRALLVFVRGAMHGPLSQDCAIWGQQSEFVAKLWR